MVSHVGLHFFTETVYGALGIHRLNNNYNLVRKLGTATSFRYILLLYLIDYKLCIYYLCCLVIQARVFVLFL